MASGNRFGDAFGSRCPTIAAGHFGGDTAFIEKHQTSRIQFTYLFPPSLPAPEVLPAVLFSRPERFVLCRKPSRCSHTHNRDRLMLRPARSASRCCISAKVRSGCCRSAAQLLLHRRRQSARRTMLKLRWPLLPPRAQLLGTNLLAVSPTDAKLPRQLLQAATARLVRLQQLATQIVRIRSRH